MKIAKLVLLFASALLLETQTVASKVNVRGRSLSEEDVKDIVMAVLNEAVSGSVDADAIGDPQTALDPFVVWANSVKSDTDANTAKLSCIAATTVCDKITEEITTHDTAYNPHANSIGAFISSLLSISYPPPPAPSPGWFLAEVGQSCADACDITTFPCDADRLEVVGQPAEVQYVSELLESPCSGINLSIGPTASSVPSIIDSNKICKYIENGTATPCENTFVGIKRFCCCSSNAAADCPVSA